LRLAHISDLHFSKPSYSLGQFFSKQWLGNLNLIFSRRHSFIPSRLTSLIPLFKELEIDALLVTGDLSTTSLKEEFAAAAEFLNQVKKEGIAVYTLPGNHDHYTKSAFKKKLFYDFFPPSYSQGIERIQCYSLKEHGITAKKLTSHWWLVAADTALATSLISSRGRFTETVEYNLRTILSLIPENESVILANHFPFFEQESPRKILERGDALKKLLREFPRVKLYLHGHTHRQCIADLRANQLPLILDSGSASCRSGGSWNLLDLAAKGCEVRAFTWTQEESSPWQVAKQESFLW
jgi:3',5'-cyclic AMP phosphodiesterase CpdA